MDTKIFRKYYPVGYPDLILKTLPFFDQAADPLYTRSAVLTCGFIFYLVAMRVFLFAIACMTCLTFRGQDSSKDFFYLYNSNWKPCKQDSARYFTHIQRLYDTTWRFLKFRKIAPKRSRANSTNLELRFKKNAPFVGRILKAVNTP